MARTAVTRHRLYVIFESKETCLDPLPGGEVFQRTVSVLGEVAGPFDVVQVLPDRILAMQGYTPREVATRLPDGSWVLQGDRRERAWESFRIVSPESGLDPARLLPKSPARG